LLNRENSIGIELYINDNKALFDSLHRYKEEIENALGFDLRWLRMDEKKASRIIHYLGGLNFDDHSNYPSLMSETIDKIVIMRKVFRSYL